MPKIGQQVTFKLGTNEYKGTVTAHVDDGRVLVGYATQGGFALSIVSLRQIVR